MLADAVAAFIDGLDSERSFDAPLVALLRRRGFYDIHFLHGAFEFGKDFIAKCDEGGVQTQYAFQSKLGNITKAEWRNEVRGQVETMAQTDLAHPGFDAALPRRSVLILTGRLRGSASVEVQQYAGGLGGRALPPLLVWDREDLIGIMTAADCLGTSSDWAELGRLARSCGYGQVEMCDLEVFSRRWLDAGGPGDLWRGVLEASILRDQLQNSGLRLQALQLGFGLARATAVLEARGVISEADAAEFDAVVAREITSLAEHVLDEFVCLDGDQRLAFFLDGGPLDVLYVSCRCLMLMEVVALAALVDDWSRPEAERAAVGFLQHCLSMEAASRPVSDDYAPSVLTTAVACCLLGLEVKPWLVAITKWVCDCYDDAPGLAPPRACALQQLTHLMSRWVDSHPANGAWICPGSPFTGAVGSALRGGRSVSSGPGSILPEKYSRSFRVECVCQQRRPDTHPSFWRPPKPSVRSAGDASTRPTMSEGGHCKLFVASGAWF